MTTNKPSALTLKSNGGLINFLSSQVEIQGLGGGTKTTIINGIWGHRGYWMCYYPKSNK